MLTLEASVSGFMPFALGLGRPGHGGHVHLTSSCHILPWSTLPNTAVVPGSRMLYTLLGVSMAFS